MDGLSALKTLSSLRGQQGDQFQEDKFVVGKLIDFYDNASTDAERKVATEHMRIYGSHLSPKARMALGPYVAMGPLSPEKLKADAFRKKFGNEPMLTTTASEDPNLWAVQNYSRMKYNAEMVKFTRGIDIDVPSMGQFDAGGNPMIWHRRSNGSMQVIPADMEQISGSIQDMSVPALIENNGWVDEGVELRGSADTGFIKIKKRKNYFTGKMELQATQAGTGSNGGGVYKEPTKMPTKLLNTMVGFDGLERGEDEYLSDDQRQLGGALYEIFEMDPGRDQEEALSTFKSKHGLAGWNFIRLEKTPAPGRGAWGKLWSGPNKSSFTVAPGQKVWKKFDNGDIAVGYNDRTDGKDHMYDDSGAFISGVGYDEWEKRITYEHERMLEAENPDGKKKITGKSTTDKVTMSVEEALKANPDLSSIVIDEGAARQKSLTRGNPINLPVGPGSGINRAAEAMRGK